MRSWISATHAASSSRSSSAELAKMTPADERFRARDKAHRRNHAARRKKAWKKVRRQKDVRARARISDTRSESQREGDVAGRRLASLRARDVGSRRVARRTRDPTPEIERSLAALMQTPTFARVRHLTVTRLPMSWDGLRGFCSCDEIKNLQSLEFHVTVGPRGLLVLLGSTRFVHLTRLSISSNYGMEPDVRGFESVSGLHALRHLRATMGFGGEIAKRFAHSPLAQRLESLTIQAPAVADASLPNLRTLGLESFVAQDVMNTLAKNKTLSITFLDVRESFIDSNTVFALASSKAIPSLRALAIKSNVERRVLDALRKRFGASLHVKQVAEAIPKESPARRKKKR